MSHEPTTSDPLRAFTGDTLTDAEIANLCRPLKQPAAQCRFLQKLGYRVERRPDGTPIAYRQPGLIANPTGIRWTK